MEFKLGHIPFIEEKQLNYKRLEFADITGLVPILSEQQLETVALQIKKNKKKYPNILPIILLMLLIKLFIFYSIVIVLGVLKLKK